MADVDIVISGGGVIGTALALACKRLRYSTLLLDESSTTSSTKGHLGFDLRTLALSPQSVRWLDALLTDATVPRQRVDRMHIWEHPGTSTIDFQREDVGSDSLAWIFEHTNVVEALRHECQKKLENIDYATITAVNEACKTITLSNGSTISCQLLVVAEGSRSKTRALAGARWVSQNLWQHAIVTVIKTEQAHNGTAWQRFGNGVLALLPLTEPRTHAIVWSVSNPLSLELEKLNDDQFKERIHAMSDHVCGEVVEVDRRLSFPLNHGLAQSFLPQPWVFVLGDAAHTIHPLAGQGMNLGLEDSRALESLLSKKTVGNPVSSTHLRALAEQRRAKAIIMQQMMAIFDNTWKWSDPLSQWVRNFGVRTFSRVPVIKKQFIREAMGFGPMTIVH